MCNQNEDGYFILNIANDATTPIKAFELLNIGCKYFRLMDTIIWFCYNRQPANTNRSLTNQQEYLFVFKHNNNNIKLNKKIVLEKYKEAFITKNVGNVWKIPFSSSKKSIKKTLGKFGHSGFPPLLCKIIIELFSNKNDECLDPLCGTQIFLRCCEELERKCDGIDKNIYTI